MLFAHDGKGRWLLARRSMTVHFLPGAWGPTAGGSFSPGMTARAMIETELFEELGIPSSVLTGLRFALATGPQCGVYICAVATLPEMSSFPRTLVR